MDIVMPSLAADMEEGMLTEWLVKVGDEVQSGDVVAVIETDKGAIDMEVFHNGLITELCLQPVITVPVGTIMATMATVNENTIKHSNKEDISSQNERPPPLAKRNAVNLNPATVKQKVSSEARIPASPVVRMKAKQKSIDLSTLQGSGPDGALVLRDLPRGELTGKTPDVTASTTGRSGEVIFDIGPMRKSIAAAMEKSKREIPHYYLTLDIDIANATAYMEKTNATREPEHRFLLIALLLRAIAKALSGFPQLNGYYKNGVFEVKNEIHIGNVITLRGGGLVVPAIHSVDQLSLAGTMQALRDVTARSRTGHLRSSELLDATITVTNIGDRGADMVLGVVYPPQVAIIGIGKPQQKVFLIDKKVISHPVITLSLSADHRVSDGLIGAKFLNAVDRKLQKPDKL